MQQSRDPYVLQVTAAFVVAGLFLFGASFNDPFHFDDVLITNDSNVTNPARWSHFLNPFHLRQLTFFTFYLNHLVGGDDPAGYHIVNVTLHIANAVLLFVLLRRVVDRWIAVAAASVFLVHPIQTEPVLYVYQRSVLLACLFSLLALIALAERRHWLAAACFFCAFESKESAVAVPLAVAVLVNTVTANDADGPRGRHLFLQPIRAIRGWLLAPYRIVLLAGSAVLSVGAIALLFYRGEATVGIGAAAQVSPGQYFLAQTRIVYTYLRLLVFPYPQSLEYEFPGPVGIVPLLGIVGMILSGWWLARRRESRIPGLCILSFFALLAPTSSIVPSADAAFEHRLYLPMLAFSLLACYLISKLPRRTWIGIAVLCVLGVMTLRRGTVWSSDVALWEDTVQHAPGKARVWFNLGGAYLKSEPDKARSALLRALELKPDFTEALYDLGVVEQGKENWNMAVAYYQRAVETDALYWPAWNNMGNTLFAMGQHARALDSFQETLRLNHDYWPAQYNVAIVHFISGRYEEALPRLRSVLDWRPDFREARYLLALTLTRAGDQTAADEQWKRLAEFAATESRNTPAMILAPFDYKRRSR